MNQPSIFLYLQTDSTACDARAVQVRSIPVTRGVLLFDALRAAGVVLDRPCGGTGQCGKCRVRIVPSSNTLLSETYSPEELAFLNSASNPLPCRAVELIAYSELSPPTANEKTFASRGLLAADERLACQTRLLASIGVAVKEPLSSVADHQILTGSSIHVATQTEVNTSRSHEASLLRDADESPIQWYPLELSPPSREDDRADQQRLTDQFCQQYSRSISSIHPSLLRKLSPLLRACEWRGCVLVDSQRSEAIDFLPDCALHMPTIMVLDLGTTTLAATLLSLPTGRELAVASRLNPQTAFGADVISRIQYANQSNANLSDINQPNAHPPLTNSVLTTHSSFTVPFADSAPMGGDSVPVSTGAERLQRVILEAVRDMLLELCRTAGTLPRDVTELIVAGNTTMQQLFMGVASQGLGEVPFAPATSEAIIRNADELGLPLHPAATVQTLPIISGFVGGDIVAGMLATHFAKSSSSVFHEKTASDGIRAELFIDIGTNGEMVLRYPQPTVASDGASKTCDFTLLAAATAAGPAFEGAKIRYGMRATTGAIHHVQIVDGRLVTDVLGDADSDTHDHTIRGLCGSALLDIVAELLDAKILSPDGRILSDAKLPVDLSIDLRRRIVSDGRGMAFVLADASETTLGEPVLLTQRDVRELQLAAGAIRAGIRILLTRANLQEDQLAHVYLAGGFGNFLRCRSAQRIGLLPTTLPVDRILSVGNSSLTGAAKYGISLFQRHEAVAIARSTRHLDLSTDPQFSRIFAESMRFPDANNG